jgi:SAM-dependent methyltransferase
MINCILCSSNSFLYQQYSNYQYYKCFTCGVKFLYPFPSKDFLTEFYSDFHNNNNNNNNNNFYDFYEKRMFLDFESKINLIKKYKYNFKYLLDIGCGKGDFMLECNKNQINTFGIDLSNTAIEIAKLRGLNVYLGDLNDNNLFYNQKFDVITFWATIEHITDPIITLIKIKELLSDDGIFLFDTGLSDNFLDNILPGVNQWYDPPQHLYVHSKKSIEFILKSTGFDIIYFDSSFERNIVRKYFKFFRNILFAISLRFFYFIFRADFNGVNKTKFPVGDLMFFIVKKSKPNKC